MRTGLAAFVLAAPLLLAATPPAALIAIDTNKATFGRSRPMCVYPGWQKYKGTGSLDDAASYACTTQ